MACAADTAKRFDEEVRLKESTSMRSTIEDCRIWMIDRLDCIQDAPLPALSKMGKLFDRLQEGIYNAVLLPEPKQMKALRVQEKSLKTGESWSAWESQHSQTCFQDSNT